LALIIRPFVRGQDETTWVDITNRAWREDEEFTPFKAEELKRWDDAPWVGMQERLIAELGGVPAGNVSVETDNTRADKKSFITGPDVVPEYRRKGVGRALMKQALARLHEAGMEVAEVGCLDKPDASGFLEALGFNPVRRFCTMRRSLAGIPSGVGESRDVNIVTLGRTDEDIDTMRRLRTEAFKEHFNFAPDSLENWKYAITKWEERGRKGYITVARVESEPAGYLTYGIDPEDNEYLKKRRGGLWDLGVLKQFRGRGIAKRLLVDAMNHLRREGMEEAELGVDETNVTNAKKVYEDLGFTVARRHISWDRDLAGFDAESRLP
jgi:ribosomal protein S18 acetylase RimI-like enzyme